MTGVATGEAHGAAEASDAVGATTPLTSGTHTGGGVDAGSGVAGSDVGGVVGDTPEDLSGADSATADVSDDAAMGVLPLDPNFDDDDDDDDDDVDELEPLDENVLAALRTSQAVAESLRRIPRPRPVPDEEKLAGGSDDDTASDEIADADKPRPPGEEADE